jgi:hypothetical protein
MEMDDFIKRFITGLRDVGQGPLKKPRRQSAADLRLLNQYLPQYSR